MFRVAIFALLFGVTSTTQCNRVPRDPLEWEWDLRYCNSGVDAISDRVDSRPVLLLAQPSADETELSEVFSQEFVVAKVARAEGVKLAKGDRLVVPGKRPAKTDELFLLTGGPDEQDPSKTRWWRIRKVTPACFDYAAAIPAPDRPAHERQLYFFEHLNSHDPQIQADSYVEINTLNYGELKALAMRLPVATLRQRLRDPSTLPRAVGLYALLLGHRGSEQDVDILARAVGEPSKEFREHINDAMFGYLLVAGETGLASLEQSRLQRDGVEFWERYALMQAARDLSSFEAERIPNQRIQQTLRMYLDDPELVDLVISDLARMGDWSVHDRLMDMYGEARFSKPATKRTIVRYMMRSEDDAQPGARFADEKRAELAKACLIKLRELDPETVRQAEKFFLRLQPTK